MDIIQNPLLIIGVAIILGQLLGRLSIGHFKLGSSGTLFAGLFISYIYGQFNLDYNLSSILFQVALIGFIVTVGLKASKSIKSIIRQHGFKFVLLALSVTMTGAISTYLMMRLFAGLKFEIIGTYIGALTSSPGLATALELAKEGDVSTFIGLGYAIAYVPGVVLVILFSQWFGKASPKSAPTQAVDTKGKFDLVRFISVVAVGIVIGKLRLPLVGASLGMTGGVLISALVMGSSLKGFDFDNASLGSIQEISLNAFLAIVGLKYGASAVETIAASGLQLLLIGVLTGFMSISMGYVIGKFVLKIDGPILIGGICGGMTSTPGLAAAHEVFQSDDVTVGYGATYPFALIGMILFTNLLF